MRKEEASEIIGQYKLDMSSAAALNLALDIARDHIGTEHILYGLLATSEIKRLVKRMWLNPDKIQADAIKYIAQDDSNPDTENGLTQAAIDTLRNAERNRQEQGALEITPSHLLVGMLEAGFSTGFILLYRRDVPTDPREIDLAVTGTLNQVRSIFKQLDI